MLLSVSSSSCGGSWVDDDGEASSGYFGVRSLPSSCCSAAVQRSRRALAGARERSHHAPGDDRPTEAAGVPEQHECEYNEYEWWKYECGSTTAEVEDDDGGGCDSLMPEFWFRKRARASKIGAGGGKTIRRRCHCSYCSKAFKPCVKRTMGDSQYGTGSTMKHLSHDGNAVEYVVDQFDVTYPELSVKTSLQKGKRWAEIHAALTAVASAKAQLTANTQRRNHGDMHSLRCTVYEVPVVGRLTVPLAPSNSPHTSASLPSSLPWSRRYNPWMKRWRSNTVFALSSAYRDHEYALLTGKKPWELVTPVHQFSDVIVGQESLRRGTFVLRQCSFKTFYGSAMDLSARNRWQRWVASTGRGPQYNPQNLFYELKRCADSRTVVGRHTPVPLFTSCHQSGFVARAPPSPTYKSWYVEFEMKQTHALVTGVVIAPRAPKLIPFPCQSVSQGGGDNVETEEQVYMRRMFKEWSGFPRFPCLAPGHVDQFVRRVEILARVQGGRWFSLGEFQACKDAWGAAVITLPGGGVSCKYLRVRPLSKAENGFEGPGPAMRVALLSCSVLDGGGRDSEGPMSQPSLEGVSPSSGPSEHMVRYQVFERDEDHSQGMTSNSRHRRVLGPWQRAWSPWRTRRSSWDMDEDLTRQDRQRDVLAGQLAVSSSHGDTWKRLMLGENVLTVVE